MAIWDEMFDTFGRKAITAIGHALDGEGGKAIKDLAEGAAIQEFKDTVKDVVGTAYDKIINSDD